MPKLAGGKVISGKVDRVLDKYVSCAWLLELGSRDVRDELVLGIVGKKSR